MKKSGIILIFIYIVALNPCLLAGESVNTDSSEEFSARFTETNDLKSSGAPGLKDLVHFGFGKIKPWLPHSRPEK